MTPRDVWIWLLGLKGMALDGKVKFEWDFFPAAWVLALVLVPAALLVAFLFYRAERKDVGLGQKVFLAGFRAGLLLLVLFMLFGPKLTAYTEVKEWSYVVVLVDDSTSMGRTDAYIDDADRLKLAKIAGISDDDVLTPEEVERLRNLSRAELVKRALENGQIRMLENLEAKLNVRYYTFSSSPVSFEERREDFLKAQGKPGGNETAIGEAIRHALQREHSVVAVVVLSDFKNNAGIDPEEVARQCRQRYLPVYTVLAGIPQTPRNIALLEPEGDVAVLAGDSYKLDFKIQSSGYEGQGIQVGVWLYPRGTEDRAVPGDPETIEKLIAVSEKLTDHPATLKGKDEKQVETVVLKPEKPGEYFVILRIEPREGESTRSDNYLVHPLRVADDRIKVLYVEHPPRYEYRFLKNALIRDTKILCHVLLTSADPDFPQEFTKGSNDPMFKEPLKEFPKTREQLFQYDVLILGDVDPGRLGGEDVWENIEAFVTEFGGGLVLISGQNNPRLFLDKPALRNLIPVDPEPPKSEGEPLYDRSFGYALTAEAKGKDDRVPHPIIYYKQFAGAPEKTVEHWEDRDGKGDGQMGIYWYQRTKGLATNASTLVEVAGAQGFDGKRPPLFVVQYNGRGRVFWSGTDETWRWRYCVGDYPWFYPFWQQAMYWVRQGKLLGAKRYRIDVDKEKYNLGERVKVYATAYDEKFHKLTAKTLKITVVPPPGRGRPETMELKKDDKRDGYYEGEVQPPDSGPYRIWVGDENDTANRAEVNFHVYDASREDQEPFLQPGAAQRIADESYQARKGRSQYYTIDRLGEVAGDVKASERIMRTPHPPRYLWSAPLVWIVFALLITLEWVLRKIWRML